MRTPGGVLIYTDMDGKTTEIDTFTCVSCNMIVPVKKGDTGYLDRFTNKLICKWCVNSSRTPFEEKIKRMEDRERTLRSYI